MSGNCARRACVWVIVAVTALAASVVSSGAADAQTEPSAIQTTTDAIPGEYVVTLRPTPAGNVPGLARSLAVRYGGDVLYTYEHAFTGFAIATDEKQAEQLARHPLVAAVTQNGVARADATQSNPPWGLDRIDDASLPLDLSYVYDVTGAGVRAYVIDTGIRTTHSQFGGRAVFGTDKVGDGQPAGSDCNGHGTHVAGTIGSSAHGVAKGVTLVSVRVLGCGGSGSWAGVIAGVDWVTSDHNANQVPAVANMSLGGGNYAPLNTAVTNSIKSGVTYAVAAGNSNADACSSSPANVPSAITVGATTNTDARASYSNVGSCLDVFAPGSSILSTWGNSDSATNTISGTSMATPHVAGVAALYLQTNVAASPAAVTAAVLGNAVPNVVTGAGAGSPNRLLQSAFLISAPPLAAPDVPRNLRASAQKGAVNLTWQAPSGGGAPANYLVYRGTTANNLSLVATLGTGTSFSSTGLVKGVTYYFAVSAKNDAGESALTATVSAKPR